MSIATQITALQADKTAIANAITTKGGTVGAGDGFDDFATDIGTIPTGTDTSDATISTSSQLFSGVTAYGPNGKVTGTLANGPLVMLYPYDYGSFDASNYYFTGKKNLQQVEPFASTDGQAMIVFPKQLMGDAQPEDVTAGKIFTSAAGIQAVGTRQTGASVEYFDFLVTDGSGWFPYDITTNVSFSDVVASLNNGNYPVARVEYQSATYFASLSINDPGNLGIMFYFNPSIGTFTSLSCIDEYSNWAIS